MGKPVITSCHDIKKINSFTDPSKICKIINCLKQGNQRSKECEDEITLEEVEIIDNIRDETIITKIIREIITSCEDITKLNDITDRSKICHIIDCFSGHPCEDEVDLTDWQQITNINEITNKTIIKKILDDITKGPGGDEIDLFIPEDIVNINNETEERKIRKIINCLTKGKHALEKWRCEDEVTLEEIKNINNFKDKKIITKIIRNLITSCDNITNLNGITDPSKICDTIDCFIVQKNTQIQNTHIALWRMFS